MTDQPVGSGAQEAVIAQAPGSAAPQRQPRRDGRLGTWWSGWLARHVPVMDDPAPGRLDRLDGVTGAPGAAIPTVPTGRPNAPADRPARRADS